MVQQYSNNVQLLSQQRGSKLRMAVTTGNHVGKAASVIEQIGATEAYTISSRHSDTQYVNSPHDKRWAFPVDKGHAELVDNADKLRMIIDPTSSYVMNAAYAHGRAMDNAIISAFNGTAKTGENGTTSTTFPAGMQIASGSVGLTIDKLRDARKLLIGNDVDLDVDPVFCLIGQQEWDDLMGQTQYTSGDFNPGSPLVSGQVRPFMGFNFIVSTKVGLSGTQASGKCFVWAKSGMYLGIWGDITTKVDELPTKNYSTQVFSTCTFGATRLDEDKVVEIAVA
jgi:hypothetical protein